MDFPISTQKNQALKKAMDELRILEKDIQEEFIRSAGAGGQKINKTSSKVVLNYR
ncbi:MAG: peptide chain release factor-like protein, partial [Gammaproteobacteria bacterium]|nr:peptide chain release factor-like protein [Gammaproteobacteria bacterium]